MTGALAVIIVTILSAATTFSGETAASREREWTRAGRLPGVDLAEGITIITGVAVSLLLGVSSVGAWRYYRTPAELREQLPWFAQPVVWGFLKIDNNASERALKRVAIGRNYANSRIMRSSTCDAAAENHARLWSLIASAEGQLALEPSG